MKKEIIALIIFLLGFCNTFAQLTIVSNQAIDFSSAVTSIKSGDWSDASIWSNGEVPSASTDVVISENHTVYIDIQGNTSGQIVDLCTNLKVTSTAVLQIGHNTANFAKDLRINGSILCNGTFSSGRNQPGATGDGLIYNFNSRIFLNLTQANTYISGSGFFNPRALSISSSVANRNLIIDLYNIGIDENFAIKSNNKVNVAIEHFAYLKINGILGLTGSDYQNSSPTAKASLTIKGIVVTNDVSLFTKNTTTGESTSLTIENQGVLYTQKINKAILDKKTELAGFHLTISSGGLFRLGEGVNFDNLTVANPNFTFTNNGEVRKHYLATQSSKETITAKLDEFDPTKGASVPQIKDVFGASHIAGWYNFTDRPFLLEGLDVYKDFGATSFKTTLTAQNGNMENAYHFNHTWPVFANLKEVAQNPMMDSLFKRNHIKRHTFWTTTKNQSFYQNGPDFAHDKFLDQEQQFYDLTKYLLETYGSMDKTFTYQNWEGDWMLRGEGVLWENDPTLIPADVEWKIEGMARLFRARQRGTERARNEHASATAKVFHAIEFNKLWTSQGGSRITMMQNNTPSVLGNVIPSTRIDLSSWSAYDGGWFDANNPLGHAMWKGLEVARYYTNETGDLDADFPVQIGEFGINENPDYYQDISNTTGITNRYTRYIGVALGLGIPNFYLWNLYGNDKAGPANYEWQKNTQYDRTFLNQWLLGKWLKKPEGKWGVAATFLMEQWKNTFKPISGNWNTMTNWNKGNVPISSDDVLIPDGKSVTINATILPLNSLTNDGTIDIGVSQTLKINNHFANNGVINLSSNNDNSAVLMVDGDAFGNITYTRGGLKALKWSLIMPPVSGQKIKEFAENLLNDIRKNSDPTAKYAIGYYDDSKNDGNKWQYYDINVGENLQFSTDKSYAISRLTDGSVFFNGAIRNQDVSKTVNAGQWNAIGNPFTTYYPANKNDNSSFLADSYDTLDETYKSIYVWDSMQEKYTAVTQLDAENRSLAPGQGFFVKMKTGQNTIAFRRAKRISKPVSGNNQFNKTVEKSIQVIASNTSHSVTTNIKFFDHATKGFDVGFDIGNFGGSSFDIFSYLIDNSNSNKYTIQSVPFTNEETIVIPLGIHIKNSELKIAVNHQNLPENSVIFLEDRLNNLSTDITKADSNYKVQIGNELHEISNRFYLHVTNSAVLSSENYTTDKITIYNNNLNLIIKGIEKTSQIAIFNILGQEIFQKTISRDEIIDLSSKINQGNYIVKVTSGNSSVSKKVYLSE
jgi:hypothetical protein